MNGRAREIQAAVYLLAGCSFAGLILLRMLLIVYGVALHPLLFVGLLAALALAAGGFVSLLRPGLGRLIAACGLAGLLTNWFPWLISLVPEHNVIPSPLGYSAVIGYLAVAGFASFYPSHSWLSNLAFLFVCIAGLLIVGLTYRQRVQIGEYDRPSIACFRWDSNPTNELVIAHDPLGCIDEKAKAALASVGLHGSLTWRSGSTHDSAQRLLVLAQARPPQNSRVFYPRHGLVVYAFDGKTWAKTPADAETYPLYSTFQLSGGEAMLCADDFSGGRTCEACLNW